jgi:hypothetical protein
MANVDEAAAIARFLETAEQALRLFPGDEWFTEQLDDARELGG